MLLRLADRLGNIAVTPGLRGCRGGLFSGADLIGPERAGTDQNGTLCNPVRGPFVSLEGITVVSLGCL